MNRNMTYYLDLAGILIEICAPFALFWREGTFPFQAEAGNSDLRVGLKLVEELPAMPKTDYTSDGIFYHYLDGNKYCHRAIAGVDGAVSLAVCDFESGQAVLYLKEALFSEAIRSVDKVLHLLPMRQILSRYDAALLHASRIAYQNKAMLFTAPSGTGKTTQAGLWQTHAGARIACNDRTLIRSCDGGLITCGYPIDGSEPVYSDEILPLGAVVVLRQSAENSVQRLKPVKALKFLMEQTAADPNDINERTAAYRLWTELLEMCPVYQLNCTPDERAVDCLKKQLEKDEVFTLGIDS